MARLTGLAPAALLLATAGTAAAPFAYITNQGSHDVSVIDLASQSVIATVPVGRSPAGVVAASKAGRVFVSNPDSKTISVIDMRQQALTATWPAGQGPPGFGYPEGVAAEGDRVYVVNWMDDNVSVLDAESGRTLHHIATGRNSRGFGAFIGSPPAP